MEAGPLGPLKAKTNLTQFALDSNDSHEELGLRLRKGFAVMIFGNLLAKTGIKKVNPGKN